MNISNSCKAKAKAVYIVGIIAFVFSLIVCFIPIFSVYQSYELGDDEYKLSVSVSIFDIMTSNTEKELSGIGDDESEGLELDFFDCIFEKEEKDDDYLVAYGLYIIKYLPFLMFIILLLTSANTRRTTPKQLYLQKVSGWASAASVIMWIVLYSLVGVILSRFMGTVLDDDKFIWSFNYIYPAIASIILLIPIIICYVIEKSIIKEVNDLPNPPYSEIPPIFSKGSKNSRTASQNYSYPMAQHQATQAYQQYDAQPGNNTHYAPQQQNPQPEAKTFCPQCGSELKPGTAFCGKCGHKIN